MNGQYTCLTCGTAIPLDDINVAGDIALCRKCGNASAFSLVSGASGLADAGAGEPPRGVRVERDPMGGGTTIIYKYCIDWRIFLLIPSLLIWIGFGLYVVCGSQLMARSFDWRMSLLGILIILTAASAVAAEFFCKYVITLKHGECTVFYGIRKLGYTRRFTYSRETRVSLFPLTIHITAARHEKTFAMCTAMHDEPRRFIAGLLQREIARGS